MEARALWPKRYVVRADYSVPDDCEEPKAAVALSLTKDGEPLATPGHELTEEAKQIHAVLRLPGQGRYTLMALVDGAVTGKAGVEVAKGRPGPDPEGVVVAVCSSNWPPRIKDIEPNGEGVTVAIWLYQEGETAPDEKSPEAYRAGA